MAVLHGREVDQFSRPALPLQCTVLAQWDLCMHAAVVAMDFHRLRDGQKGDGQEAEAADGREEQMRGQPKLLTVGKHVEQRSMVRGRPRAKPPKTPKWRDGLSSGSGRHIFSGSRRVNRVTVIHEDIASGGSGGCHSGAQI